MSQATAVISTLATLIIGAGIAWTGDLLRDRRSQRDRDTTQRRATQHEVELRRWEASLAVLNQANTVYARARDLATNNQVQRLEAIRIELETARGLVTTSLSAAFLLNPRADVRDALARVISCCRELGDEALQQEHPTLTSLDAYLKAHRTAIKNTEAVLRQALGIVADVPENGH